MSFMTKKNQPVDTETRMRLIKRNISNALYGSGNRNAKTRFSGPEDFALSSGSRGLDALLTPYVVDSGVTSLSLSFLLSSALSDPTIKFVIIYSATYQLGVGDQVGILSIDMTAETWNYNLITTEATNVNNNGTWYEELNGIFNDDLNGVYNTPVVGPVDPGDIDQGYINFYAIQGIKDRQFFVGAIPELLSSPWTEV